MSQKFGTPIVCPDLRHVGIVAAGAVTTASTSYVTLGSSDLSVTLPYPASGVATIFVRGNVYGSVINILGMMSFEIRDTNSSGTQQLAANDAYALMGLSKTVNESLVTSEMHIPITGLPTSGTMYVRAMYRSNNGSNTAGFVFRGLSVIPSP